MTSQELAEIYDRAESRWMTCALRSRLDDSERMTWKMRFCARAVTLLSRWHEAASMGVFLVLSTKRSRGRDLLCWWGPGRAGYTSAIDSMGHIREPAGRYTATEALRICRTSDECEPVLLVEARRFAFSVVPADSDKAFSLIAAGRAALARAQ